MEEELRLLMTAGREGRDQGAAPGQDPSQEPDPEVAVADPGLIAGRRAGPGADPRVETEMDQPREMRRASPDPRAEISLGQSLVKGRMMTGRADQDPGPGPAQPTETEI